MSYYLFTPTNNCHEKLIILLNGNDIKLSNSNNIINGKLHKIEENQIQYKLVPNIDFIGGMIVLKKDSGTLIYHGSGLRYRSVINGKISKL